MSGEAEEEVGANKRGLQWGHAADEEKEVPIRE